MNAPLVGTLIIDFQKRFAPAHAAWGDKSPTTIIRCTQSLSLSGFRVTALFGPSGCGKTTILRCIAGLERPDTGTIVAGTDSWFDAARALCHPPQRRRVGMLFQDYALFPHMSARRNIAYGLPKGKASDERIADLVKRFRLEGLEHRAVTRLSGGEQQRVALARAIAPGPGLLLLDEPLAALDTPTRREVRDELRALLAAAGVPVILVTHDDEEVRALADDVWVMNAGEIIQQGPVPDVFANPATPAAARILGRRG